MMDCSYPGCTHSVETGHVMTRWAEGDNQFYCPEHFPGELDPLAMVLQGNPGDTRSLEDRLHDAGYRLTREDGDAGH